MWQRDGKVPGDPARIVPVENTCETEYFMTLQADAGKIGVSQVSEPAVLPIFKSAARPKCAAFAGLETRDTADLEVCGTGLPVKYPG